MARNPLYIGSFLLGWVALVATAAQAQPASAPTLTLDTPKAPATGADPELEKIKADRQAVRDDALKTSRINILFEQTSKIVNQNLGGGTGKFFVTFYIDPDPIAESDLMFRGLQMLALELTPEQKQEGHSGEMATAGGIAGALVGGSAGATKGAVCGSPGGPLGVYIGAACGAVVGAVCGFGIDQIIHYVWRDKPITPKSVHYLHLPFPYNPFSRDAKYVAKGMIERIQIEIEKYSEYDPLRYKKCMKESTSDTDQDCNIEWDISPLVGAEAIALTTTIEGIEP